MIVQASAPRNGDLWDAVRKLTLNAENRKDEIFLVQLHRYFLGEIDISFIEVEKAIQTVYLPSAYHGCTCDCHRIPGIHHVIPCCRP